MPRPCSQHFSYSGQCPACRANELKDHLEELEEELEEGQEENRRRIRDLERLHDPEFLMMVEKAVEKKVRERAERERIAAEQLRRLEQVRRLKVHLEAALSGLHSQHFDEGLTAAYRAIEMDEGYIYGYNVAVLLLVKLGRDKEALTLLGKYIRFLAMPREREEPSNFLSFLDCLEILTVRRLVSIEPILDEFCRVLHENPRLWGSQRQERERIVHFLVDQGRLRDAELLRQRIRKIFIEAR